MLTILKTFLTNKCFTESINLPDEKITIAKELKAKLAK